MENKDTQFIRRYSRRIQTQQTRRENSITDAGGECRHTRYRDTYGERQTGEENERTVQREYEQRETDHMDKVEH